MIEIIKTENPDVVIQRKTVDTEVNLQALRERKAMFEEQLANIVLLEIDESFPDYVKDILREKNEITTAEKMFLETDLADLISQLEKYGDNI